MQAALYDAQEGYYAARAAIGPAGDFSTSARFPAFGRAIARLALRSWKALGEPADFRILEVGGGAGDLARVVTAALRATGAPARYETVEPSRSLRETQGRIPGVEACETFEEVAPAPTFLIANEVLDALPVHRLVKRAQTWREMTVGLEKGDFAWSEREVNDPRLVERVRSFELPEGSVVDVSLGYADLFARACAVMPRGYALFIDYGDDAPDLYRKNPRGTLATFRAHERGEDPFVHVGEQDITADVDFAAATRAATAAGLAPLLRAEQGALLWALGLADEAREAKEKGDEELLKEIAFLVGPQGLGGRFEALLFSKNAPPLFLSFRLRRQGRRAASEASG